jgi:hypothetical protein
VYRRIIMAVGDAVALLLGPAQVSYQPSSGVEEQVSAIVKDSAVDVIETYDGTNLVRIIEASAVTFDDDAATNQRGVQDYNIAIMITNTLYLRKLGTTDLVYVGGVQTNA